MATRSLIAYETQDGVVYGNYCHWDGYPKGVGRVLLSNWNTPEAVEALTQYDMSSINEDGSVEYWIEENDFPENQLSWGNAVEFFIDYDQMGTEYHYLLRNTGEWQVSSRWDSNISVTGFVPLDKVLTRERPDPEAYESTDPPTYANGVPLF